MSLLDCLEEGVREGVFPGAAFAVGTRQEVQIGFAGRHTYHPDAPPVGPETLWDLASVTKVLGTTTIAMILADAGQLDIDRPVQDFVPAFAMPGVTVRNLLRHDAGLVPHRPYDELCGDRADAWRRILSEESVYPLGSEAQYSCVGFMVLFQVLTTVLGCGGPPEDPKRATIYVAFFADRVGAPLGLAETGFNPSDRLRCAPTEVKLGRLIQGEVHDENARLLGGVSGNAGLFAPLGDLARFGQALLEEGLGLVGLETFRLWTRRQEQKSTRGLGWDTKSATESSAGTRFGPRSFGHLGFTGTSIWVDPEKGLFAVLLTNRVHPTRENLRHITFRPRFHDAAYGCALGEKV